MATDTYTGPQGGDWFDPANWSAGSVPATGDVADLFGPSAIVENPQGNETSGVDATAGTVAGVTIDLSGTAGGGDYFPPDGYEYPFAPNLTASALGTTSAPVTIDVTSDSGSNSTAAILLGTLDGSLDIAPNQSLVISATYGPTPTFNGNVSVNAGASLAIAGFRGVDAYAENPPVAFNRLVRVEAGTLSVDSNSVTGTGAIEIGDGGTATFSSITPFSPKVSIGVTFESSGGTLNVSQFLSVYTGTISGFGVGDTIIVPDGLGTYPFTTSYANGMLTVTPFEANPETFDFAGNYTLANFDVRFGDGAIEITYTPCFAAGTVIATPQGGCPVQDLTVGDLVDLANGDTAPIVWVGSRRQHDTTVVRIKAGALDTAVPHRDLVVSTDHAVLLSGVLVQAGLLVNGETIIAEHRATVTFHHVELEQHGILLAEGAPAESYLDTGNRGQFSNCPLSYDETRAGADLCAEMVFAGERLQAIRRRLEPVTV